MTARDTRESREFRKESDKKNARVSSRYSQANPFPFLIRGLFVFIRG